jgi:hypothetical protein
MGGKRGRGERSTPAQTYSGGGERAGMEPKRGKTKMGCRETLGGNNVWVGGHVSELFFLRSGWVATFCYLYMQPGKMELVYAQKQENIA